MREARRRRSRRCARSRRLVARGGPRRHPAGQAARTLRPGQRHAGGAGGRGARHPGAAPEDDQRPRGGRGHRRRGRRGAAGGRVRPDPARRGPVPLALRERPLLAAARLPRGGAGGAGGDGRGRGDRRDARCSWRPASTPARSCWWSGPRWARTRRAARCWRGSPRSGPRCWCGRSTRWRPGRSSRGSQPEEGVSFAPKIGPEDRALDLRRPAAELARRVRALAPHIGATAVIDGQPFKVWGARTVSEPVPPGLSVEQGRLLAGTGAGTLEITAPPAAGEGPDGRRRLPARLPRPAASGRRREHRRRAPPAASRPSAPSPCACCAGWTRAPTPTAPSPPRRAAPSSTRGRVPAPPAWPTARCSAAARSTGSSTAPSTGPRPSSPPCATSCASGAYEVAFSDAIPDHAAVDQAVRQARALRGAKARCVRARRRW